MLMSLLQFTGLIQSHAVAQSADGIYSVNVNTPGTFGQVMLQMVDNWSDVVDLTVSGRLNDADMAYFSRMQNMTKLDLGQAEISGVAGCGGLGQLQTVILPESVRKVADGAFKDCTSLSTINLGNVVEIGSSAFQGCTGLTGTLLLSNLMTLGPSAFQDCYALESVEMPLVTRIENSAFMMSRNYDGRSALTMVVLPNVESIGHDAFRACDKLQSINIPKCIYLGADLTDAYQGSCFQDCASLASVTLSDELEYIPTNTFVSTGLQTVKLPSGLKAIGDYAFENGRLSAIDIPEGVKSIGRRSFYNCPLESITLPSTVESVGNEAFFYKEENYNSSTGTTDYSYILKDVCCRCVVPLVTSVFNNDMAKGATLRVPAFCVSAYKLDDNWYMFNKIEALDGDLTDVTINNTFTIIDYSGLAENANLTLASAQTAGHLTISGSDILSLNNFIQNQNYKRDESYENGNMKYSYPYCTTMIVDSDVRANSVATKISLPTNSWSFISLPYDVNVSSIIVPEGTMWVVRKYNGANRAAMSGDTWENVTSGQMLNAGEGYIIHCVNESGESGRTEYIDFEFPAIDNSNKNKLFTSNDVVKEIKEYPAEFSHNRGWNLIGNPYPSYMSSRNIDFTAPITVWNGDGYTAYSLADDEYVLRPNEAFFVQCPVNTNKVKFLKDGRTHDYEVSSVSDYFSSRAQSAGGRSILNFILSDEKYSDRARLVLNETAAYDYEIERDASKFMSSDAVVPQIYIIDNGVHYAIDERPVGAGEYSLGVRIGKDGDYKISLNADIADHDILLIDKEANMTINLAEKPYTFESASGTINNRFTVKIMSHAKPSSIDNITDKAVGFTVDGHRLSVDQKTPVAIYSIDGKLVYRGIVDGSIELSSGIYLVTISNTTHKIAIK